MSNAFALYPELRLRTREAQPKRGQSFTTSVFQRRDSTAATVPPATPEGDRTGVCPTQFRRSIPRAAADLTRSFPVEGQ